ncbi:MAG TPA: phenylalanine--tRNA ligase subunit alpha, partial [Oceanipulchritudo sp.]|nr:phenylalanine--tRNA ligase subunit alpha [Oceanipulchritudo sp.]
MEEELKRIIETVEAEIAKVSTAADFEQFKARISGPNGSFTGLSKQIATLPVEERPMAGKLINIYKQRLQAIWDQTLQRLEAEALAAKIGPAIDPSLESPEIPNGTRHILVQVREEIVSVLRKIGFIVADGPEVETEYYCFDALNTPRDHPARDLQDTYY